MRTGAACFGKETQLLLSTAVYILALFVGNDAESQLCYAIACCYQADSYNQSKVGDLLSLLISSATEINLSDRFMGMAFAYASYLATARHFQLNLRGFELLGLFLAFESFRESAANLMLESYYGQSLAVKIEIIDSIDKINEFDEELSEQLREKVLNDGTKTVVAYFKSKEAGCLN